MDESRIFFRGELCFAVFMKLSLEERVQDLETAYHEGGHALVCVLENVTVDAWGLVDPDSIQRVNRRPKKTRNNFGGWVDSAENVDRLLMSVAGHAAADDEEFLDVDVHSLHDLLEIYHADSDQAQAWRSVECAHLHQNAELRPEMIAGCIRAAYGRVRSLFNQVPYAYALGGMAAYMLQRRHEADDRLNERMIRFLHTYGVTADMRSDMRKGVRALNLPGLVRMYAFPRMRVSSPRRRGDTSRTP